MKESEKNSSSFKKVLIQCLEKLQHVPQKIHWRAFLDLADFAKRESKFEEARNLFHIVSIIQPYAYQGWLEFSKMEEECGNQNVSRNILLQGLKFNPLNENLFIKAIKVEEKIGNFTEIRNMIKKIMDAPIEKTWRILLEGALFEGRTGNREAARSQFKHLLRKCKTHGPIYLEASKFEERENSLEQSIDLCEEGLEYNVKYSPLWFHYLKLYEKSSERMKEQKFEKLSVIISDMFHNISKEFHWKVSIELAQMLDRLGHDKLAKYHLSNALYESPDNVKWKLWLVASRIMLN